MPENEGADLARRVLERAQREGLRPRSRAWSVAWQIAVLSLLGLTVLSGALAMGLTLGALWPDGLRPGGGFVRLTLGILPLLWLLFLLGFAGFAVWVFRRLRYGYRARASWVLAGVLGLSMALGVGVYAANGAFMVHRYMMVHLDSYRGLFETQRRGQWNQPEAGRLAGVLVRSQSGNLILRDWSGREWPLRLSPDVELPVGDSVRVRGEICAEGFCAQWVRPWQGGMGGQGAGHGGGRPHRMR